VKPTAIDEPPPRLIEVLRHGEALAVNGRSPSYSEHSLLKASAQFQLSTLPQRFLASALACRIVEEACRYNVNRATPQVVFSKEYRR
jgi:hypothetical protein